MLRFDHLPVEMCMMVFEHLVEDYLALATIRLVSRDWCCIMNGSRAWTLLWESQYNQCSKSPPESLDYDMGGTHPVLRVQHSFRLNNHTKLMLLKLYWFNLPPAMRSGHRLVIFKHLLTAGNVMALEYLDRKQLFVEFPARHNHNYLLYMACRYSSIPVIEWFVNKYDLTSADVLDTKRCPGYAFERRNAFYGAFGFKLTAVLKWLVVRFRLSATDVNAGGKVVRDCSYGDVDDAMLMYELFPDPKVYDISKLTRIRNNFEEIGHFGTTVEWIDNIFGTGGVAA